MKFHALLPTLRLACSVALANNALGKLSPNAALVIAFQCDDTVEILFVADTASFDCPQHYAFVAVILDNGLDDIASTILNPDLSHEQNVEKLTNLLLTSLSKLVYGKKLTDPRVVKFVTMMDGFSLCGIFSGIAALEKTQAAKRALLPQCDSPEQN